MCIVVSPVTNFREIVEEFLIVYIFAILQAFQARCLIDAVGQSCLLSLAARLCADNRSMVSEVVHFL